jgi:hypothetical protein
MFGVHRLEDCWAHAEVARSLPYVDAGLHHPGCSGPSKSVRRHVLTETSTRNGSRPRVNQTINFLAVVMADIDAMRSIESTPASQVREYPTAKSHRRCPFLALGCAWRTTQHHLSVEINPAPLQGQYHARSAASVKSEQNETRKMRSASGGPEQSSRFIPRQPTIAWLLFWWKPYDLRR